MDDVNDKMKDFMKNFSSFSSCKFKGQERVLGSPSSGPTNSNYLRPPPQLSSAASAASRLSNAKPAQLPKPAISDEKNSSFGSNPEQYHEPAKGGLDPFDSLVTSSKRSENDYSRNVVECPICNQDFKPEEVFEYVDSCVSDGRGSIEKIDQLDSLKEKN